MFKFPCPKCQQKLSAEADQAETTIQCPSCGADLQIPSPPVETETKIASPHQASIQNPSEPIAIEQNTPDPSFTQAAAHSPQKGFELPQSIKSLASNKQASAVLADLRSMDFKAEIAPVDSNIIALIKKDFVFWAVSLLAIVPLVLVTLNDTQSQLTGFLLFFAAIWGVILNFFLARPEHPPRHRHRRRLHAVLFLPHQTTACHGVS
jgi:DNA-directed RNA polymerase subunit M/transcription elongation factor TFIIS